DQPQRNGDPFGCEILVDPANAVDLVRRQPQGVDPVGDDLAATTPGLRVRFGVLPVLPRIVAGALNSQNLGHQGDGEGAFFGVDQLVLRAHGCSFAKKAAAFFKNAFSCFKRAISLAISAGSSLLASGARRADPEPVPSVPVAFATHRPSVDSLMSRARATSARDFPRAVTIATAAGLNPQENCLRGRRGAWVVVMCSSFLSSGSAVYSNHDTPIINLMASCTKRSISKGQSPLRFGLR